MLKEEDENLRISELIHLRFDDPNQLEDYWVPWTPPACRIAYQEITKAIWAAKLTTDEIREWFPVSERTDEAGTIIRYYVIAPAGWLRISSFLDRAIFKVQ